MAGPRQYCTFSVDGLSFGVEWACAHQREEEQGGKKAHVFGRSFETFSLALGNGIIKIAQGCFYSRPSAPPWQAPRDLRHGKN